MRKEMIRELEEAQALRRHILGVPRPTHGRLRKIYSELAPGRCADGGVKLRVVRGGKGDGSSK